LVNLSMSQRILRRESIPLGGLPTLHIITGVMSLLRRGCLLLFIGVLMAGLSPFLWRNAVKLYYNRSIYDPSEVPQQKVAVVFGAAVYANGRLSPVLRDRVDTAIALYKTGQVDHILV